MEWIKTYTIKELEKKENLNYRTIKKRTGEYIPVFVENWPSSIRYKKGKQELPYMVKYIRRIDLDTYFSNGKNSISESHRKVGNRTSLRIYKRRDDKSVHD